MLYFLKQCRSLNGNLTVRTKKAWLPEHFMKMLELDNRVLILSVYGSTKNKKETTTTTTTTILWPLYASTC